MEILIRRYLSAMMQTIFIMLGKAFHCNKYQKLICAWHFDKSWRDGLKRHISTRVKQAEVYHRLRVLISEEEELYLLLAISNLTVTCHSPPTPIILK